MSEQLSLLRKYGRLHRVPLLSPETEQFLRQHIETYRPLRCLEIWSAIGYSTLVIWELISQWNGQLASFEISVPSYRIARSQVAASWLTNITLHYGDIMRFPSQQWNGQFFDFVFVDGAKAQYKAYIELIWPHLSPRATLICDDVILYADKIGDIWDTLDALKASYQHISLADGDGILLIKKDIT